MLDILITGATILDGTGAKPYSADIGILNGLICDIGELRKAEARHRIDAAGKCVAPGFIDAHSHSDAYILIEPSAESKITQGITTEIVGNCGASAAPLTGAARMPSDWQSMQYPGQWRTVAEYRQLLDAVKPAVNIALLAGHNTIHGGIAGYERIEITPDHISAMQRTLEQAMDEGASGLSTGLLYSPGMFAGTDEVTALCRTVAAGNGIYTTHMRSESSRLLNALEETFRITRATGVRTQVSHLKTAGRKNWHLLDSALDMIHTVRDEGFDVAADRYPYTSSCTDLDVILPSWAQQGTHSQIISRLSEPGSRKEIIQELAQSRSPEEWAAITIGSAGNAGLAACQGRALTEIALELNLEPPEAAIELMIRSQLKASAFFAGMSEDNMLRILSESYVMVGTDASLRTTSGPLSSDFPHPRAFGSFPRFLRIVREQSLLTTEEAVRKITSLPARQFNLKDRGIIRKSFLADITIFSPASVNDTATFAMPHGLSQGIDTVIVNGIVALADGRLTGRRPGRFLA